jgi:formylglycine-generating enzyme required for sulfatase activity
MARLRTINGEVRIGEGTWAQAADFWEGGVAPGWAEDWGEDAFGPWAAFRIGAVEQRLRWVPPGRFWMGSPADEEGRFEDEGPRHEVVLTRGFWLFATPCTQALWQAVMGDNPSHFLGAERPVEGVSWEECQAFVSRVNGQVGGLSLGLPTGAQWEHACRVGTAGPRYAEDLDAIAWYRENSGGETHAVGGKAPNGWGLYDMLGNVYEWCQDGPRKYTEASAVDPVGSSGAGADRVIRGGNWDNSAQFARAAFRDAFHPGDRRVSVGFRCSSSG